MMGRIPTKRPTQLAIYDYDADYYSTGHEDPDCRVCSHEAGRALVNEYEGGKTPLFHKNDARWPHHTRAEHVPDCPANKEMRLLQRRKRRRVLERHAGA